MEGLVFVGALALVVAAFFIARHFEQQRRAAWLAAATKLGLTYAPDDPFGLVDLPFDLFGRGDGREVENVAWGKIRDREIKIFEYWYYEEHTDPKGHTSRSTYRFTCALAPLPMRAPPTSISRESLTSRLADFIGFKDQGFESEEFNKTFQVRSDDERFASYLIDARMMEWLLASGGHCSFDLSHGLLLCTIGRIKPHEIPFMAEQLLAFLDHVPRVVIDVYGEKAT